MKRTLVQFDEETYQKLRRRAFEGKRSISSVVREFVAKGLEVGPRNRFTRVEQFSSVAAGRSKQSGLSPISEHHDEALAEAIRKLKR
jgi:hypothetical protein